MTRVLYVNGNIMKRGGIEAFMMNYFRKIDKEKVHIDFVVHGYEKGVYDDEILAAGSTIYHVPTKSRHPIRYQKELTRIFNEGKYDVVHSHLDAMSGWVLRIAKKCGVPVRIAHSHNTKHMTTNPIKIKINDYAKIEIGKSATHLFACSDDAGKWLFGKDASYTIINNAIDLERYRFDESKRVRLRQKYDLQDSFVIGHVGRFDFQKNQEFLLRMLATLKNDKPESKLLFLGDGVDYDQQQEYAKELGIYEECIFLGSRGDVADFYNVMDVFVLPSRFEGLGIVAIEAQTNGLPCIVSSEVPASARICPNVWALPIDDSKTWADFILQHEFQRDCDQVECIREAGYSIDNMVAQLQEFYVEKGRNGL